MEAVLIQALLPYVVDDVFFPIPPERAKAVHDELLSVKRPVELGDAVAELALAFRAGVDADSLLQRLSEVVDLAARKPRILAIHIRVLDTVAYRSQQRYHRYREIFGIRRKLSSRLLALNDDENADVAILKWSASWLLNATALAVGIGELELARESVHVARDAVGRLPEPRTKYGASDRLWLASRLSQIEGRLAIEPLARIGKLREAVDSSFAAIANTPSQVRWVRLALRAAHRLSEELQTDEERDKLLADIDQRLTIIFGNHEVWPLSVKAQGAALARDTAARSFDPTCRLQQVWRFLDRFKPAIGEAKSLAQLGDARPLLVLARSYAFSATCNDEIGYAKAASECQREALRLAREALDAAPSAAGWDLCLRLLDQAESVRSEAAWHTDPLAGPRSMIGSNLRESLNAAREWLKNISLWGREEEQLALWCLQREWQSQGSLERWAATTLNRNEFWDELKVFEKRQLLKRRHRERQVALDAVERRGGPFLELYVVRMRNEAQLQRLLAIYSNHISDIEPVLRHIEAAKRSWPDSHGLLKEEGRFHRYVWNYPSAIFAFRRLIATAPRASERREATADLVEVLLTAAAHCEQIRFGDGSIADRASLVSEARTMLVELRCFRHISREVAMLSDRANLEAGITLDWDAIDDAFSAVVGDIDAYTNTLVNNLYDLRASRPDLPERLADLVVAHFTSAEVLRDLGWVYLRRVELGVSADFALDCQKAYAAFQACRILEMAWSGSRKESATTSYQRGRAILTAVKATGEMMPFKAHLEGKRNLLHLAETLFTRTVNLTVGLFHLAAKSRHSEATRLQQSWSNRA